MPRAREEGPGQCGGLLWGDLPYAGARGRPRFLTLSPGQAPAPPYVSVNHLRGLFPDLETVPLKRLGQHISAPGQ